MKFGRNLPQFTVPEWSASYIKYKALKKLIKSAAEKVKAGQEADLAGKRHTLIAVKYPRRYSHQHPSN
jgi:glycerophosphodiester phosphodiesterase